MGARRTVTVRDVADIAGVSPSTVSRVLNGGGKVSDPLRARVTAVADSLGYVRSVAAQALRGRRTAVFVLVSDPRSFPIATQAAAIEQAAKAEGVLASIVVVGPDTYSRGAATIRTLRSLRPRAIIVSYPEPNVADVAPELNRFIAEGGRVVTIGEPGIGFPTVEHDDTGNVRMMGHYLASLGRRRPAIVTDQGALRHRLEVMLETLAGHGFDPAAIPVEAVALTAQAAREAALRLVGRAEPPDLIYATNDVLALAVLDGLLAAGVRVPDEVMVAGHDNIPLAGDATPGLTTIALDFAAAGRAALEMSLASDQVATVLPGQLIVRQSTALVGA